MLDRQGERDRVFGSHSNSLPSQLQFQLLMPLLMPLLVPLILPLLASLLSGCDIRADKLRRLA